MVQRAESIERTIGGGYKMNIPFTVDLLSKFARLLETPNLSKQNEDAINHTMSYMINGLHAPIVKMVDEQK